MYESWLQIEGELYWIEKMCLVISLFIYRKFLVFSPWNVSDATPASIYLRTLQLWCFCKLFSPILKENVTNYEDKIPFWPNSKCFLYTNVIECHIQTHVWKETNEITGILAINLYILSVWFVTGIMSSTRQTTFASEPEFQEEGVIIGLTTSFPWKKKTKNE